MTSDLLLLHGAIGSAAQFDGLSKQLSEKFRVHAIDFSGHGNNQSEVDFSIPQFAGDVLKWMMLNAVKRIDIFGYSMGGYVALYLAKHHPEKVGRIFTLGTKFNWTPESAVAETKMLDPVRLENKVPDFARTLAKRHAGRWKSVLAKTSEMMMALGNGDAMKVGDWKSIAGKVLLAVGDRDKMVGVEETMTVQRAISGSDLLVLPATPHPIEQVDERMLAYHIARFFGPAD